jgi:hypothetical protein
VSAAATGAAPTAPTASSTSQDATPTIVAAANAFLAPDVLAPCPEALGIMVIAIGLNRTLLGLGLIVSFSFGLAAVLIVISMYRDPTNDYGATVIESAGLPNLSRQC